MQYLKYFVRRNTFFLGIKEQESIMKIMANGGDSTSDEKCKKDLWKRMDGDGTTKQV